MVAVIDKFLASVAPSLVVALDIVWMIVQLILLIMAIVYGFILWRYDIKVNIREYSKGGRVIASTTKAVKFKDKNTGAPKLKLFGTMGFRGEVISEPPAECMIAHRSRITNKMYDFIKKDGLYIPVNNLVLGVKEKYKDDDGNIKEMHTLEGSGLEITRDYDSEQAIQNILIEKATAYRNKKPTEIIASYALMIIVIIGSFVIMW